MSKQDELKKATGEAAIDYIESGSIVGVGTGSTVNYFIEALSKIKNKIDGAVASSKASEKLLRKNGIEVLGLNEVGSIAVYVDGADEVNKAKQMIKGGGGALTGEKIVAASSEKFICIADESKRVDMLGSFPVPLEVIPMARGLIGRKMVEMNADPEYRQGFVSDYGNIIIDVHNMKIMEPIKLENELSALPGVVTCGIFANNPADVVILGTSNGIEVF